MATEGMLRSWFPDYLSVDAKNAFEKAFGDIDPLGTIFAVGQEDYVQGAAFTGFVVLRKRGATQCEEKEVAGIILSNSCDIDQRNPRSHQVNVTFAPLLPLEALSSLWRSKGVTEEQINNKINMVKKQSVSHLFYLPSGPHGKEAVVDFSTLGVMQMDDFVSKGSKHIFTLDQVGYYFFLIKLSIHFLRLTDGVQRGPQLAS